MRPFAGESEAAEAGFKLETMIENFSELSPEERARLVETERQNIERSNEGLRLKAEEMRAQNEQLRRLLDERKTVLARLREVVAPLLAEDERIEREVTQVLLKTL